jgi:hypothetical protein
VSKFQNSVTKKFENIKILDAANKNWWQMTSSVPYASVLADCSDKACLELALSKTGINDVAESLSNRLSVLSGQQGNERNFGYIFRSVRTSIEDALQVRLVEKADKIIKDSKNDEFRARLFNRGLYSSLSTIDAVALSAECHYLMAEAARLCSITTLRKLKKRKELPKDVALIVFDRLGPAECLDDMINDKYANNRQRAYRVAPFGYKPLEERVFKEIAQGPTYELIMKLRKEVLPMLLGNRNLKKNKWLSNAIEQRLNGGE